MLDIHMPGAIRRAGWLAFLFSIAVCNANAGEILSGSNSVLINENSGLCLGVKGSSAAAGSLLQSQTCSGSDFQRWKAVRDAGGGYRIINIGSGLCVDVTGGSKAAGTNLQQWGCSGGSNQTWDLKDQGGGRFGVISRFNGLALEVYEFSKLNGARVVQWNWHGGSNQRWSLPSAQIAPTEGPASGAVLTLKGVQAGKCVGVAGAVTGAAVQSQDCSGSAFQQWRALRDESGAYELSNLGSGQCLDLPGGSATPGLALQQWGCSGGAWQKWEFHDLGAGRFKLVSKRSGLALDVDGMSTASGAKIIQWPYWGGEHQQWTVNTSSGEGPIGFGAGVSGGAGGAVVTVTTPDQLRSALCGSAVNGVCTDSTPRVIRVSGVLNFRGTEGAKTESGCTYSDNSCSVNGKSERILNFGSYCAGRALYPISYDAAGKTPLLVGSNKTVIGVGRGSGITGKGLILKGGVSNIAIRNLSITDINDGIIWAGDAITLDNVSKVWIDQNYIARIGRQMIVAGYGTAQNVTISNNFFDGSTEYGHYCNGKHYWAMLLVAENQSITLANNRILNTSGRSPKVDKPAGGSSGGVVHIVNNLYEGGYYTGVGASENATVVMEGNYFAQSNQFRPIQATPASKLWAPLGSNITSANGTCLSVLGRNCVENYDTNAPDGFLINAAAMSDLQASPSALRAIRATLPKPAASVSRLVAGPSDQTTP